MKNKILALLFVVIIGISGCGISEPTEDNEVSKEMQNALVRIYTDSNVVILVDTETKVMYGYVNNGHGGTAMTLLVNADGSPKIYEGELAE